MSARLQVYYDGLCPLCSREIDHYRTQAPAGQVEFVDIMAEGFAPESHALDPKAIHKHMHVRLDGKLHVGVPAFFAIWEVIPGYRWLKTFLSLPGVYWLSTLFYECFAVVRPMLPRKACATGQCAIN